MVAKTQTLLSAFGETEFFREAYTYNLKQIYEWLEAASNGTKGGVSPEDKEKRELLAGILTTIKALSLPDGTFYENKQNAGLRPNEHFRRDLNSSWRSFDPDDVKNKAKFILRTKTLANKTYWSPYDLLGYFFSLLGPAPQTATKNNFFLPLTAVYARWSSKIAGRHSPKVSTDKGTGPWPYMFQCTWFKNISPMNNEIPFSLGASLAGSDWTPEKVGGGWRVAVGLRRFEWLSSNGTGLSLTRADWDNKTAPNMKKAVGNKVQWGNCAETYPFTEQMRDSISNKKLLGLALQRQFLEDDVSEYEDAGDGRIWECLSGPCNNCKELLQRAGAYANKFDKWMDKPRAAKPQGLAMSHI